jgi:hypothetical protein
MAKPTSVREWNIQGLPNDSFSTENGVIVTSASRWPLMVDPPHKFIPLISVFNLIHSLCTHSE